MIESDLKENITIAIEVGVVGALAFALIFFCVYAYTLQDDEIIGEGEVENMRIDSDIGLENYILTINSKDFEVRKSYYNEIEVGYIVRIFSTGRVEILNSTISTKNDCTNCS